MLDPDWCFDVDKNTREHKSPKLANLQDNARNT